MASKIKTVFIDIDGTLTDNFHIHVKGWKAIVNFLGGNISDEFFEQLHGANTETAIKMIASKCNCVLSDNDLKFLVNMKNLIRNYEINKLDSSNLFDGVIPFLVSLQKEDIRIVCCSITTAYELLLTNLGIISYFTDFVCGSEMKVLKSVSPSCFINYIEQNNLSQSECIVIDDDIDVINNLKNHSKINYVRAGARGICHDNSIPCILDFKKVNLETLNAIATSTLASHTSHRNTKTSQRTCLNT